MDNVSQNLAAKQEFKAELDSLIGSVDSLPEWGRSARLCAEQFAESALKEHMGAVGPLGVAIKLGMAAAYYEGYCRGRTTIYSMQDGKLTEVSLRDGALSRA